MLSRLKKINPGLSASSIALVIAMLSVFIALGSDNAPCLSANATCTVGQNPEFTGDIDIKNFTIPALESGLIDRMFFCGDGDDVNLMREVSKQKKPDYVGLHNLEFQYVDKYAKQGRFADITTEVLDSVESLL